MIANSGPIYTKHVSSAEMAEQSKTATAEGMRQLAEAIAARAENFDTNSEDDSDLEYDSDDSFIPHGRKRSQKKPKVININRGCPNILEDRIRFLQLDLSNALVDVEDAKNAADIIKNRLSPIIRVNDELGFLKSAMTRGVKDSNSLTKTLLEERFKIFQEETTEHSKLCLASINKIDMEEIKAGLMRVLVSEQKKLTVMVQNYKYLIFRTHMMELGQKVTVYTSVSAVVVALLYQLVICYFLSSC
jgi:hypothetical protein